MADKKPGKVRSFFGKVRKKIAPTFGEQFSKAKSEGKSKFRSTRDDKKKGKLEYHTRTKAEESKAQKKYTNRERARSGDKSKQLSDRGAKFKLAKKMGKDSFTHKGKKYSTLLKGFYSPDMGMKSRPMYAKGGLIKGQPKLAKKGW